MNECNLHEDNELNNNRFVLIQLSELKRNLTPTCSPLFCSEAPSSPSFPPHLACSISLLHLLLRCSPCALLSSSTWGINYTYFYPLSPSLLCNIIEWYELRRYVISSWCMTFLVRAELYQHDPASGMSSGLYVWLWTSTVWSGLLSSCQFFKCHLGM